MERFMISCEHYDYIEIVCTYQYPLKLTTKFKEVIDCIAKDTSIDKDRNECVNVSVDGSDRLVPLDEILTMEVKVDNPHFKLVTFN
jgi:Rho-binding antiterminator